MLKNSNPPYIQVSRNGSGEVGEKKCPGWPGENVFRMLVPVQKVGGIIGQKGEYIKRTCEETSWHKDSWWSWVYRKNCKFPCTIRWWYVSSLVWIWLVNCRNVIILTVLSMVILLGNWRGVVCIHSHWNGSNEFEPGFDACPIFLLVPLPCIPTHLLILPPMLRGVHRSILRELFTLCCQYSSGVHAVHLVWFLVRYLVPVKL